MKFKFLSLLLFISAFYSSLALASSIQIDTEEFVSSKRWGAGGMPNAGNSETVTWSYLNSGTGTDGGANVTLDTFMPVGYQSEIQSAFDAWTAVSGVSFVKQVNGSSSGITIGGHSIDGANSTLAHANTSFFSTGEIIEAGVHFDTSELWNIGFSGAGYDIFQVAAHEIGHAIGLSHTNIASSLMNPLYSESFSGPQADDINGAVFLYGNAAVVPLPGAFWLMLSGIGLLASRKKGYV